MNNIQHIKIHVEYFDKSEYVTFFIDDELSELFSKFLNLENDYIDTLFS